MSNADLIRRAAEVLREAAESATPGPWGVGNGTHLATEVEQTSRGSFSARYSIAEMDEDDRESGWAQDENNPASPEADACYIALMQPSVGLAVAAWLQDEANGCQTPDGEPTAHAVALAEAVLAVDAQLEAVERITG